MKKHFGKIFMLAAAMLVTVPSAVVLSACGGPEHEAESAWQMDAENHWHNCKADANDEHKYDLGEHTWKIEGDVCTCTVCQYQKAVVSINDQQARTLQLALQKYIDYRGVVTANVEVTGDEITGTENGTMIASYDPDRGIGYYTIQMDNAKNKHKVYQDGDRYIEYQYEYYCDPDTQKVSEETNYALVDQEYVRHLLYDQIDNQDFENDEIYQQAYNLLFETKWNSATIKLGVALLAQAAADTGADLPLQIDNYQIDAVTQGDLMTVTLLVQGSPVDAEIETDVTAKIKLYVDTNDNTLTGIDLQAKVVATVGWQQAVQNINSSISFAFNQTGYNKVTIGSASGSVSVKTSEVSVMCQVTRDSSVYTNDYQIELPYNTAITADNINDYTAKLQAEIASYGVDPTKIQITWTNSDYTTPYNGSLTVSIYPDLNHLYAQVTIAE